MKPEFALDVEVLGKGDFEFGFNVYGDQINTDDFELYIEVCLFKVVIRLGWMVPDFEYEG